MGHATLSIPLGAPASQIEDYRADRDKSVVELQQFRELTRLTIELAGRPAEAQLIDLNPSIGTWYLLELVTPEGVSAAYHLESLRGARLRLDPAYLSGIVIERRGGASNERFLCELWPTGAATPLTDARDSRLAYAPLCGGMLYLRNPVEGHRTPKERVVELLRDHVWQGEELTAVVRDLFYRDAYLATSSLAAAPAKPPAESSGGPLPPLVSPAARDRLLVPENLEIGLAGTEAGRVAVGRWYPAQDNAGIFVTTLRPDLVSPEVIADQKRRVAVLDPIESAALAYLVAFDLEGFDLGYRLGTDHPRVGWSEMVVPGVRDDSLTGPDGIDTIEPLVRTGMLSPMEQSRVAATFTGGFKRTHGAFRMSELARIDHGSHYGFIENGVVLSKLQPGLATVVAFEDGRVDLFTWTEADDALLPRIRHARQNGVAILERDTGSLRTVAGPLHSGLGPGQLVRFRRQEAAHPARRALLAGVPGEAVPDLRLLLERHALRDGARVPGLQLQLRDAAGHERAGAHLHGRLSHAGLPAAHAASDRRHGRRRRIPGRPAAAPLRQRRRQP